MVDILLIALVPMLLVVVVIALLRSRRTRKPKAAKVDHQTRRERAVWGWAKVVEAASQPAEAGGRRRVKLQLEIHTPGTAAYLATTTWSIEAEALAYVEVGKEISVKVDPLDLKYVYPNGPWAKYVE
jgi:hypothetical protein